MFLTSWVRFLKKMYSFIGYQHYNERRREKHRDKTEAEWEGEKEPKIKKQRERILPAIEAAPKYPPWSKLASSLSQESQILSRSLTQMARARNLGHLLMLLQLIGKLPRFEVVFITDASDTDNVLTYYVAWSVSVIFFQLIISCVSLLFSCIL